MATRKYKTADDVQDAVKMVDAGDGTFLIAFATKNTPTNTKNKTFKIIDPSWIFKDKKLLINDVLNKKSSNYLYLVLFITGFLISFCYICKNISDTVLLPF